jgi:hypothetical protein
MDEAVFTRGQATWFIYVALGESDFTLFCCFWGGMISAIFARSRIQQPT